MRTSYLIERQLLLVLGLLTPENRLVCRLMLATGLRVTDALSIPAYRFRQRMTIYERKTGKPRRVYVPSALYQDLLMHRGGYWLFPSPRDPKKHRTRQAVWADLKRAAKACRMSEVVAPHSMRKVYAVDLMRKYGDIAKVQQALAHDRIEVTMLYALADSLVIAPERPKKPI